MNFNEGVECFFEILNEISDNYIYMCDMKTGTFRYAKHLVDVFNLPNEVIQNPFPIWKSIIHPQDWQRFLQSNTEIGKNGNDNHFVEFRAKTYDGEYIWLKCCGKVIRDENEEPFMFAGIMTELGPTNKKDSFETTYTRDAFYKKTKEKCQGTAEFAMIKIDIDNLKIFNEIYGRITGDFIIGRVSELIQEVVGEKIRVYKLEANSFYLLLDNVAEVGKIYQETQFLIEQEASLKVLDYPVQISAGCAYYPKDADNDKNLTKNCELALQYAKENGKNRLVYFSSRIRNARIHNFELQKYLDRSVRNDFAGFKLNYQLQMDTETGVFKGAEALLRWESETLGSISPLEFIPILEKNGLIVPVGLWTIRKAMRDAQIWLEYCPDFSVSINVSLLQITRSDFISDIKQLLKEEGVSPSHIILELTESCMVENLEYLKNVLGELHELGFKIAIDDFGTGYSSLGLLKLIQADVVKLDKIFLQDIANSRSEQTFIRTITELCHSMGMEVVQEGVEEERDMDILRPMGIDYIQGFLYSRPQDDEKILEYLKRKKEGIY